MNPLQFQNGKHLLDSIHDQALKEMDDVMVQRGLSPCEAMWKFLTLVGSPETPYAYKLELRNRMLYSMFQIIDSKVLPRLNSAAVGWTFLKIFNDVFSKYQDVSKLLTDCLQPLRDSGFMHNDYVFDREGAFEDSVFCPFCDKIICSILHGVYLEGRLHAGIQRDYLRQFYDISKVIPEARSSLMYILYVNLVFDGILHRSGYQYEMFEGFYPKYAIQGLIDLNQMP